jgi:uncharacterized protein (DUF849 family)
MRRLVRGASWKRLTWWWLRKNQNKILTQRLKGTKNAERKEKSIVLQAAINGGRTLDEHPNLPVTPEQLAAECKRVIEAGAVTIHFHVRQADGRQSIMPEDVSRVLTAVRTSCPNVGLGISTTWDIAGDRAKRYQLVSQWTVLPDYVSVNLHEDGSLELIELLLSKGIGIEAGLKDAEAAERLYQSGFGNDCLRILLEPLEENLANARVNIQAIEAVLDQAQLKPQRLLHGTDATAWDVFYDAVARGYDTRIGFEDVLTLPDGTAAENNAVLIEFADDYMKARHDA